MRKSVPPGRISAVPSVRAQAALAGLRRSGPLDVPPDGDHAQEDGRSADDRDCLGAFETHQHVTFQRPDALHPRPGPSFSAAVTTGAPPATLASATSPM